MVDSGTFLCTLRLLTQNERSRKAPSKGAQATKAFLKWLVEGQTSALKRGFTPILILDSCSEGLL